MLMPNKKRAHYVMVDEADPGWTRFWNGFPKRVAKKDARKAWSELRPDAALVEQILDALAWQVESPQWQKDGGQFIPYPASYLRGRRFEDQPPPPTLPPIPKSLEGVHAWMLKRAADA